jgi:HlyD family secretion protein
MTSKLKYLIAFALPMAGLLVMAGHWLPSLIGAKSDYSYDTVAVTYGPIRKVVATTGPVRALVTVSVGSQLSGQISQLKADFNTEVKAGDVLAIIDDESFAARVEQAKADLAAAEATLTNQQAALNKAEAVARNAERLLARQQTLESKGVASTTALDNATRDAEVARAEINVAQAQVENARATIAQRKAQLSQALIDLDRTRIRSPIDGTVIARTVDVGQTVAASFQAPELFKIAQDLRRIRIEAQVSEADVGSIAEGGAVEFKIDAYPERRFSGRVTQIRLGATELNNVVTYTVIIEAANEDRRLLPGMTADVRIESDRLDRALRISSDALRFKPRDVALAALRREQPARRLKQELEVLRAELALSREQVARINALMTGAEIPPPGSKGSAAAASTNLTAEGIARIRKLSELPDVAARVITDVQKATFETWRKRREQEAGRRSRSDVTVWLLNASGTLDSRIIDLGLMDDNFAEILGGALKEGDRLVVRSRAATR